RAADSNEKRADCGGSDEVTPTVIHRGSLSWHTRVPRGGYESGAAVDLHQRACGQLVHGRGQERNGLGDLRRLGQASVVRGRYRDAVCRRIDDRRHDGVDEDAVADELDAEAL